MANPITWRNIGGGGGVGNVASLMRNAQTGMDAGFTGLTDIFKQREELQEANRANTIGNNTADYLDAVAAQTSVDGLQGASGALQEQLQGYGRMIDRDAVRGALMQQEQAVRTNDTANMQYLDTKRIDSERDHVDQIGAMYSVGDFKGGDAYLAGLQEQGIDLRDNAALAELRTRQQLSMNQEGRSEASHNLSQKTGRLNLENAQATAADRRTLKEAEDYFNQVIQNRDTQPGYNHDDTYFRNQVQDEMVKRFGVGAANAVMGTYGETIDSTRRVELMPEQQEQLANQLARHPRTAEFDATRTYLQTEVERIKNTNPFLQLSGDPYEAKAEVMGQVNKLIENDAERRAVVPVVQDLLDNGVAVYDKETKINSFQEVTPSIISYALETVAAKGKGPWYRDIQHKNLKTQIETLVKNPEFVQQVAEKEREYKNKQAELGILDLERAQWEKAVHDDFVSGYRGRN